MMERLALKHENERARKRESAELFWCRSMAFAVVIIVFVTASIAVTLLTILLQEPIEPSEKILPIQKFPSNLEIAHAKE